MRNLFLIFLTLVFSATVVNADQSVLKNPPTVQPAQQETGWIVVPYLAGRRVYQAYVVPVQPQVQQRPLYVPPPVKPQFKTPVRDGAYYGLYYSRLWRWNRLGNKLNVQPCPGGQCPKQEQPVTPNDP